MTTTLSHAYVAEKVAGALAEDIGTGDITAELVSPEVWARAEIRVWQEARFCGRAFAEESFAQVDERIERDWEVSDGDLVATGHRLVVLHGPARALLSVERTALNFMQTLSGTTTLAARWADIIAGTGVKLTDTRKTIPGLRRAQKYAVLMGECHNHREGLFDAYLIKENHIQACGSIARAIVEARRLRPDNMVEVEVEDMGQLNEALEAKADWIMLDNFTPDQVRHAVEHTAGRATLEASGGLDEDSLLQFAQSGVDYISIGALTKNVRAVDLSMEMQVSDTRA